MPPSKHRRKGKTRPRGKPPKMPWFLPLGDDGNDEAQPPDASDLLDWHPRVRREPDPRQGELFAGVDRPRRGAGVQRAEPDECRECGLWRAAVRPRSLRGNTRSFGR